MLTKSDIHQIRELFTELLTQAFTVVKKELKEEIVIFKNEILKEIQGLREEVAVVTGYKDQIEDHEERITSIEKKLQS